jgi:hypothetical protein
MTSVICPICGSENPTIVFTHNHSAHSKKKQESENSEPSLSKSLYHCNYCKKDFGGDTSSLENSTIRIDVKTIKTGEISQTITFYKTSTGVTFEGPFICYYPELPELYYDQETCSRFLKSFYELYVIDWGINYGDPASANAFSWDLAIKFEDHEAFHSQGHDLYPPYWDALMDLFVSLGLPNIKYELGDNFL